MRYKRNEPFRFQFQRPIPCVFKILKTNNQTYISKAGSAEILDLSTHGLRFKTHFNLPVEEQNYYLEVSFVINRKEVRIIGKPVWKKNDGKHYSYGVHFTDDEGTQQEIIQELKEFTKRTGEN